MENIQKNDNFPLQNFTVNSEEEFEDFFYLLISHTLNVQLVDITNSDSNKLTEQEIEIVKKQCVRNNYRLLYRVFYNKVFMLFDPTTRLTGLVPENSLQGFSC